MAARVSAFITTQRVVEPELLAMIFRLLLPEGWEHGLERPNRGSGGAVVSQAFG